MRKLIYNLHLVVFASWSAELMEGGMPLMWVCMPRHARSLSTDLVLLIQKSPLGIRECRACCDGIVKLYCIVPVHWDEYLDLLNCATPVQNLQFTHA